MRSRLIAVSAVVVAVLASTAAGASEDVTLKVRRFYDPACACYRIEFSGTISSRQAGEYVTVLQQKCGFTFSTAVAGATTMAGGFWEVVPFGAAVSGSATFRARWKEDLSNGVTVRSPLPVRVSKRLSGGRFRVWVGADSNLSRRFVVLQRLVGGRWTAYRRTRLEAFDTTGQGTVFETTFVVRPRGLRLRVLVPAKSAAPCYGPAVSQTFVS